LVKVFARRNAGKREEVGNEDAFKPRGIDTDEKILREIALL
jgi:hypothetical protein